MGFERSFFISECIVNLRLLQTERSFEPIEMAFFRLYRLVLGPRPKWDSNDVFLWFRSVSLILGPKVLYLRSRGDLCCFLILLVLKFSVIGLFVQPIRCRCADL